MKAGKKTAKAFAVAAGLALSAGGLLGLAGNMEGDPETWFSRSAPLPTLFQEKDLLFLLGCRAEEGKTEEVNRGRAGYRCRNMVDGRTFELDMVTNYKGNPYLTHIVAEKVAPGMLNIEIIDFDNEKEALTSRKETEAVLNYIGGQLRSISLGGYYKPHRKDEGQFTAFGRFMTRVWPREKPDTYWLLKP